MGTGMKRIDNRGMSLVEIIIVIALMSVIAGVTGYGLSLIGNKPVEECTKKVEMALNRNRTNSMGKKDAWLEFYLTDNLITVKECFKSSSDTELQETVTVIGVKDVNMCITYDNGAAPRMVTDYSDSGNPKVAFTRDSGAVKKIDGVKCLKIEIFKGDSPDTSNKKTIKLDALTGKVTIE